MRCFIALSLPEDARRALALCAASCRESLSSTFGGRGLSRISWAPPKISWVRAEGYHLTLAFLGEIDGPAIEVAAAALDVAASSCPIGFRFAGLDGFPSSRGPRGIDAPTMYWRVLFAKLDEGGACAALHRAINSALAEGASAAGSPPLNPEWSRDGATPDGAKGGGATRGRPTRTRPFAPHVTLARAGDGAGIPASIARRPQPGLAGAWTIGRCALYKSELRSSGSVYTEIRGVDLSGK